MQKEITKESISSQNISSSFTCIICGNEKELVSVGECNHLQVCSYCAMKSRLHYDNKKCPVCLKLLEIIFICEITNKIPYEILIKQKEEFYEDEEFDKCGIYYTTKSGKEKALKLRGFICPIKNCHKKTFGDVNKLSNHLNKAHKKFYCPQCLNENKLFISQMKIYNQSELNDHIKYGEYDNNNLLISPPHVTCPFDGNTFYNEERLFSHMNSSHFICQICKNNKNVIFYSELKNLLAHYKDNHYCCPFEECLANVHVVFIKEEELIAHLITKHNLQNANERLNQLIFDRKKVNNKEIYQENGEFNFTEYIKNIKEESEYFKINNENYNDQENEEVYRYDNDERNSNNYYNKNNRFGGINNRGRRGNKNYYINRFNNYHHNKNYYKYGYQYKKNNNSNLYNIEEEKNNQINNNNYSNTNQNKYNKYYNKDGENKKYIDYSTLFSFYLNTIKEFITNKIQSEKIKEKFVCLSKEIIYQIIVMIDKLDSNDKLIELTFLNYFGIDLDVHKSLKSILISNTIENEQTFKNILQNLEIKKLLIIYNYLNIGLKKIKGSFFKLDLEQIKEDLYDEFCERKKEKDIKFNIFEKEKRNRRAFLKAELNVGNKVLPEDKKVTEINYEKNDKKEDKKVNVENIINPKTKISMSSKKNEEKKIKNKKGKGKFVEFNINDYNLKIDFPKLKKK